MVRQISALAILLLFGTSHAAIMHAGSSAFLSVDGGDRMRPDVVAQTLAHVEEEWRKDAASFTEDNNSVGMEAPGSFAKSCATVVSAIIQGSGGDRDVAKEYMNNVCSQKVLEGWHKDRCTALASSITEHAMLADSYANRQNLDRAKVCSGYWSIFVEAERNREAEEAKVRAEQEKVRAEEEKKAAIAAAEAKKEAEAEARAEAERRAKEEDHRKKEEEEAEESKAREEAKARAEEAKARAAEAAARLVEKKAEAEKVQKEAQQKMEEAEMAEKEHQARLEEHQRAEELLRNASSSLTVNSTEVSNSSANVSMESPADSKAAKPAAVPVVAAARPAPQKEEAAQTKPSPVVEAKEKYLEKVKAVATAADKKTAK